MEFIEYHFLEPQPNQNTKKPQEKVSPKAQFSGYKRRKMSEDSEIISEEEGLNKRGKKSSKKEKNRQAAIE